MIFWGIIIGLTCLVSWIILRPLLAPPSVAQSEAARDLSVFKDQMRQLDKEVERGILAPEEAEASRVEIGRRILAADKRAAAETATGSASKTTNMIAIFAILGTIFAGGFGLYAIKGAAGLPDLPLSLRLAAVQENRENRPSQAQAEARQPKIEINGDPSYVALVEQLRTAVAERPDDVQGHQLLATHETRLGNFANARKAKERAIELQGAQVRLSDYTDLAEILVFAAGGYVSPEAENLLVRILQEDPRDPRARYYSGLFMAQTGRPDVAYRMWTGLLQEGPENAPWIGAIRADIVDVARDAGISLSQSDLPGPDADAIAAANDMSPEDRAEMIRGMVSGLSDRLATEGGTPAEWARLIRALGVLGETGQAQAIYTEAQDVFAEDQNALALLREAAQSAEIAN